MSQPEWTPERGDIIWLDFSPQTGHEQAGRRPALVLSPASYNRVFGLALVCPITSRSKGFLWEVPVPAGLSISGVILTDQVRSLDWKQRNGDPGDVVPRGDMERILGIVRRLLE